ncbi:hypothetical protein RvY_14865 [Ramazzottius varieornatus]|uniref:Uncharacterized protein n=1 Tax=Ramazzottius varieornatus TaxID=947166 RepID=A0A1D1VWG5_RAMVA|nr:hypothetical protein RvY_14865 [Ramazzottius varieornatus]
MEHLILLAVALCCGAVVHGQMGGPVPLPMPGAGNGPMNPFTGPVPARQMNMNGPYRNINMMNNYRNVNVNRRPPRPAQ